MSMIDNYWKMQKYADPLTLTSLRSLQAVTERNNSIPQVMNSSLDLYTNSSAKLAIDESNPGVCHVAALLYDDLTLGTASPERTGEKHTAR